MHGWFQEHSGLVRPPCELPHDPKGDPIAKEYERKITVLCIVQAVTHVIHLCVIFDIFADISNDHSVLAKDFAHFEKDIPTIKTEAAFEFTAVLTLLGLAMSPKLVEKYKRTQVFREDIAAEHGKNAAILFTGACVFLSEIIVFILDCMAASIFSRGFSNAAKAHLACSMIHLIVTIVFLVCLSYIIIKFYQYNHANSIQFEMRKEALKKCAIEHAQNVKYQPRAAYPNPMSQNVPLPN